MKIRAKFHSNTFTTSRDIASHEIRVNGQQKDNPKNTMPLPTTVVIGNVSDAVVGRPTLLTHI